MKLSEGALTDILVLVVTDVHWHLSNYYTNVQNSGRGQTKLDFNQMAFSQMCLSTFQS